MSNQINVVNPTTDSAENSTIDTVSNVVGKIEDKTFEMIKLIIDKYIEIVLDTTLKITRSIRLQFEDVLKNIGINKHKEWDTENKEIVELYARLANLGDFLIKSKEIRDPINSIFNSLEELINPHIMNIIDQNIDTLDESLQKLSNNLAKTIPEGLKKIIEGSLKGAKNGLFAAIPPPFDSGGLAILSILSSLSTILNSSMLLLDTFATTIDALSSSANKNIEKNVATFQQTKKTIDNVQNQINTLTNTIKNIENKKRELIGQGPIPQNLQPKSNISTTKKVGGSKRKYKTPRKKRKKKRATRKRKKKN